MFLYRTHSTLIQFYFFQTGPKLKVRLLNPPRSCQHCRRGSSGHEPVMLMPAMQWLFPPTLHRCWYGWDQHLVLDSVSTRLAYWVLSEWGSSDDLSLWDGLPYQPSWEGTPQLSVRPDNFQNLWTFVEWTRNQHWHCKLSYGSWLLSRLESLSIEPMFGIRKVPRSLRITSCRWVSGWTSPNWIRYASRTGIVWWSLCCWGISVDLWPPRV